MKRGDYDNDNEYNDSRGKISDLFSYGTLFESRGKDSLFALRPFVFISR